MEETFMISQLMTQLSNLTKSERYQQDKVMITQLVVCWILLILKKIQIKALTVFHILEKSKETILELAKGTASVVTTYKCLNTVNVKLSDTQMKKLRTAVKDKTGTTLRISLKMFHRNDLPHELLLTRQKTKLRNAFNNNMSTDLKLSRAQISKIIQSGGFLGSLLSKLAGPLMKVAIPLAKNVFAPLRITATASAIDAGIQKKMHDSGGTTLIISNEEINDIMKVVQALENSNILLKGVTKTVKNETKEQKGGF